MSELQNDIKLMKEAGFNPTEVENYKKEQVTIMQGAGFLIMKYLKSLV